MGGFVLTSSILFPDSLNSNHTKIGHLSGCHDIVGSILLTTSQNVETNAHVVVMSWVNAETHKALGRNLLVVYGTCAKKHVQDLPQCELSLFYCNNTPKRQSIKNRMH